MILALLVKSQQIALLLWMVAMVWEYFYFWFSTMDSQILDWYPMSRFKTAHVE